VNFIKSDLNVSYKVYQDVEQNNIKYSLSVIIKLLEIKLVKDNVYNDKFNNYINLKCNTLLLKENKILFFINNIEIAEYFI
jgi:hypothetical protein